MSRRGPAATAARRSPAVRDRPPEPGPVRSFAFPHFLRRRLPNGLGVVVARQPRFPLVSLELILPAGGQYADRAGLAAFHGSLLDEGTEGRDAMDIARTVERLGGSFGSGAGWDVAYLSTGFLAEHLDAGLALLAEAARQPSFPEEEVERLRRQRLTEILRQRDRPAALAGQAFARLLYGDGVYGEPLIGREDTVAAFSRDDIVDFNRRHVGPGGATVLAVGDLDPEAVLAAVEEAFGDWPATTVPTAPEIVPVALDGTRVTIVDRPGAAQTEIQVGHVGVPRRHPDYARLVVMNALLGGKFTSRINLNLRERHGFTYGASSRFARRQGPGPFVVKAAVGTETTGAAVRELLFELRRIRDEPVGEEELDETRLYLVGVFPYTLQTVGDVAKRIEDLVVFDLPDDYYDHYAEELAAVSRDDVTDVARRHLHPDRLAIVAVGPAAELRAQLEPYGPVTVTTP